MGSYFLLGQSSVSVFQKLGCFACHQSNTPKYVSTMLKTFLTLSDVEQKRQNINGLSLFFVSVCNIKNSFIDDYALDSKKNSFFYFSANFARGILPLCARGNCHPCLINPQRGFLPPDLFPSTAIISCKVSYCFTE